MCIDRFSDHLLESKRLNSNKVSFKVDGDRTGFMGMYNSLNGHKSTNLK